VADIFVALLGLANTIAPSYRRLAAGRSNRASSRLSLVASVGGTGQVTLDYGSGSPQEAAAYLAYLNAAVDSRAPIGHGAQWSDSSHAWTDVDWKTAGYWAGLRAAAPLTQDDGLNYLRLNQPAPFGFHYFEVVNEVYGNWETDHHGEGGDPGQPHDPATYVAFAQQFASLASSIDPTIAIGVDSGSDGVHSYTDWLSNVLQQGIVQGFIPDFVSDHSYMQSSFQESDSYLLLHTVSDPNNQELDWLERASGYRTVLQQALGSWADGVELLATEFNSVGPTPGKQTTSLVNGLFVADSIGSLLQTEYNGATIWALRSIWSTSGNNSPSLYGWRQGGDYGLLGRSGAPPSTGTYVPYPTYFAEQLLSNMLHTGDTVVQASSDDPSLSVYSVLQQNGHLDLLVINKDPDYDLTGQFQLTGFQPDGQATFWQYGKTQDTAQSQTTDGHSALATFTDTLALDGSSFSYAFPAYSMTVVDLSPAGFGGLTKPSGSFNRTGIVSDRSPFSGGFHAGGHARPANLPGRAATLHGNTSALGAADSANVVQASGQMIALPADQFLALLAAAVNSSQPEQTATVSRADSTTPTFTQPSSDWAFLSRSTGESIVANTPSRDPGDGAGDDNLLFHLYSETAQTLILPKDGDVNLPTSTLVP
jgi:hypothetical protein